MSNLRPRLEEIDKTDLQEIPTIPNLVSVVKHEEEVQRCQYLKQTDHCILCYLAPNLIMHIQSTNLLHPMSDPKCNATSFYRSSSLFVSTVTASERSTNFPTSIPIGNILGTGISTKTKNSYSHDENEAVDNRQADVFRVLLP